MQLAESNIQSTFSISPFDEYYLPSVNRNMFEKIDSKTQYDKRFNADFSLKDKLNIIVGMDSGLLVNYLLAQGIPDGSIFIFVELDAVISLLKIDIPEALKEKLFVYSLEEFQQQFPSNAHGLYILKNAYKHHRSLAATSSHLPEYSILNTQVVKMLEAEHVEQKLNSSQKKYFEQQFKNVAENISPASLLIDKFNGKSCLVIAGGPSLDENIDWIKNNHNKLVIIAVSRIAGKLVKEGITPHIIVSVDPYDFSFEVNRDMMTLAGESLFVNSFHVSSRLLAQWQGKSLFMDNKYPWQITKTDNITTMGPTVTNASVHLATKMGFSQILMTGVDLCFTDSGYTHTKGSVESKIGPNLGIMGEWVETYSGAKAETVVQLRLAMEALADEAQNNPQIEFINLSANAAKIENIYHRNTNELAIRPVECSPKQLLDSVPDVDIAARKKHILSSLQGFERFNHELLEIKKLATEALKLNAEVQENPKVSANNNDRIAVIDAKINKDYANIAKLIKTFGLAEFSAFLTTKNTDDWDTSHRHQMTENYYKAVIIVTQQLLAYTEETQHRLAHRLSELSATVQLSTLAEFWRQEQQHGRVHIWLDNHPNWREQSKLDSQIDSQNTLIDQLLNEYEEQLSITPKEYIEAVKESASMEKVFEKIIVLIRDDDHTGLLKMSNNLKKMAKTEPEALRLYHLAYSHQLQLEKNDSEALSVLLGLNEDLRTEVELKQISLLALKLGNIEVAEQALSQVSKFCDDYMPQHAHILKIQGKYQQSLDIYLDYLDKYPADVPVLLKLGIFMFEIEQLDSAKIAFQQALQNDANNVTALDFLTKL